MPSVMPDAQSVAIASTPPPADPAPLGLAAFALTTFLLSVNNANWTGGDDAWIAYALGYGGLVQLLAGMWEFRNRNVFGATAFSTYGGFWIGLALFIELTAPSVKSAAYLNNDLAWILVAFAIFNTYMLLWSMTLNWAIFGVFITLEATEIVYFIAKFDGNIDLLKASGVIGVVTAAVAWYASAAGVINGMSDRRVLPVGPPLLKLTRSTP